MALSRARIVDEAYELVRSHGLAALSMRRLAGELGVQAGALYYHVASKQELLVAVAERILPEGSVATAAVDPARAAHDIRAALFQVRDSAEVVSFVHAFKPEALAPLRELAPLLAAELPAAAARRAEEAAQVLVSYILGFVAAEQNEAELVRAKLVGGRPATAAADETFRFGVEVILRGLATRPALTKRPPAPKVRRPRR